METKFINDATTQTEELDTHCNCGLGSLVTEKANDVTELNDWGETEPNGCRSGLGFETANETNNEEGETQGESRGIYLVDNLNKSLFHTVDESLKETWDNLENEILDNRENLAELDENINNMHYEGNTTTGQSEYNVTDFGDIENFSDSAQFHTITDINDTGK